MYYQGALGSYPLHTFGNCEELIGLWSDEHKPYVWPKFHSYVFSLTSWIYKDHALVLNKPDCLQISDARLDALAPIQIIDGCF